MGAWNLKYFPFRFGDCTPQSSSSDKVIGYIGNIRELVLVLHTPFFSPHPSFCPALFRRVQTFASPWCRIRENETTRRRRRLNGCVLGKFFGVHTEPEGSNGCWGKLLKLTDQTFSNVCGFLFSWRFAMNALKNTYKGIWKTRWLENIWVFPKIEVGPQKSLLKWMKFAGKTHYFRKHPYYIIIKILIHHPQVNPLFPRVPWQLFGGTQRRGGLGINSHLRRQRGLVDMRWTYAGWLVQPPPPPQRTQRKKTSFTLVGLFW